MAKDSEKEEKKSAILKEEEHPDRRYGLLDEVQIIGKKRGKAVDTTILRATKSGKYIWEEKIGEEDVNPDKIVIMRINFQYIGKIEIYHYVNEPERLWIATKNGFSELSRYNTKILWKGIVKTANMQNLLGSYTPKQTKKRWQEYKDKYRELRKRMKEQGVDHESKVK